MNRPFAFAFTTLAVALAGALALALAAGAAKAQVSTTTEPGAAAAKGGYVAEERKPLAPATEALLRQINALRAAGAICGGQAFAPAEALQWSEALERAAAVQARDMARVSTSHTPAPTVPASASASRRRVSCGARRAKTWPPATPRPAPRWRSG